MALLRLHPFLTGMASLFRRIVNTIGREASASKDVGQPGSRGAEKAGRICVPAAPMRFDLKGSFPSGDLPFQALDTVPPFLRSAAVAFIHG